MSEPPAIPTSRPPPIPTSKAPAPTWQAGEQIDEDLFEPLSDDDETSSNSSNQKEINAPIPPTSPPPSIPISPAPKIPSKEYVFGFCEFWIFEKKIT